ncbi:hypothetical protein EON81_02265 [bacterium]|nr:MAG: hypothetical protein EON81_02265 [bacterium]
MVAVLYPPSPLSRGERAIGFGTLALGERPLALAGVTWLPPPKTEEEAAMVALLCLPALIGQASSVASRVESIPMYVSDRRILVMLRIGDNPPAPVVFDTGSGGNLLDLEYANHLGMPKTGPSRSVDGSTGKPVEGFETTLENARLGGVPIHDKTATVFRYNTPDEVGIFGPYNFPDKLVSFDFAKSVIRIESKDSTTIPKGPSIPYDETGLPQLTISLPGMKVDACLDSGNDAPLLLPLSLAAKLPLRTKLKEVGSAVSAAGTQPIYSAHLKGSIRIASVEIKDTPIFFMKGGTPNVGLPVMRQLALKFDPTEKRTWVLGGTPSPKK